MCQIMSQHHNFDFISLSNVNVHILFFFSDECGELRNGKKSILVRICIDPLVLFWYDNCIVSLFFMFSFVNGGSIQR